MFIGLIENIKITLCIHHSSKNHTAQAVKLATKKLIIDKTCATHYQWLIKFIV